MCVCLFAKRKIVLPSYITTNKGGHALGSATWGVGGSDFLSPDFNEDLFGQNDKGTEKEKNKHKAPGLHPALGLDHICPT